jgi:D-arabinose 1-dehydrogenase-like Zn-dependent alcohol dehydrogenase
MANCTVFRGSDKGVILRETQELSVDLFGNEVLLHITAAGLCGTDEHFRHHSMVLGHEGIGTVEKVGPNVRLLHVGDRVGWGYQHDSCGICKECLAGKEIHCPKGEFYGTANTNQGAFATQAIWREPFLFRIPEHLTDADAAPLMCAGSTVFFGLQMSCALPGARIGILGMGGLGHLAIQFASKQGYKPIVLSRTESKEKAALELGATEFHLVEDPPNPKDDIQPLDVLLVTASQVTGELLFLLVFPCTYTNRARLELLNQLNGAER